MAPSEYAYEGHLLRASDGVLEHFVRFVSGSKRIPIQWVAVEFKPARHDRIRVQIGVSSGSDAPFYSSPMYSDGAFALEVPGPEEANLRAYLDEVAASAGRQT